MKSSRVYIPDATISLPGSHQGVKDSDQLIPLPHARTYRLLKEASGIQLRAASAYSNQERSNETGDDVYVPARVNSFDQWADVSSEGEVFADYDVSDLHHKNWGACEDILKHSSKPKFQRLTSKVHFGFNGLWSFISSLWNKDILAERRTNVDGSLNEQLNANRCDDHSGVFWKTGDKFASKVNNDNRTTRRDLSNSSKQNSMIAGYFVPSIKALKFFKTFKSKGVVLHFDSRAKTRKVQ